MPHAERDPATPPSDSLAEAIVVNHVLLNHELIESVDLGPLLNFPEYRWCWQAMVRVHMRSPEASFGKFYLAWVDELESVQPGQSWPLIELLDIANAESDRAWRDYRADRARYPDAPLLQSEYQHGFRWWLARLKRIAQARLMIHNAQEQAERAWRLDVDGAIAAASRTVALRAVPEDAFGMEIPV